VRLRAARAHPPAGIPLDDARPALESQLDLMLSFWDARLIDPRGGYALGHDATGRPTGDTARHLVTQARVAWFFARLARSPYGEPRHLDWSGHGVAFLRERMWDSEHGGFFWAVGPDGPLDSRKHLYGQAFALFALSEFAHAAGDDGARMLAIALAEQIREEAYDHRHGGYVECRAGDWSEMRRRAAGTLGYMSRFKTVNTHLHLLEAFSSLAVVHPGERVRDAIRELMGVLCGAALGDGEQTFAEPLRRDLKPPRRYRSSYGHDVEGAWLLRRSCRAAGVPDEPLLPLYRALWQTTLAHGFDWVNGGVFDSGPAGGEADRREKVWWVQAEALISALELFRWTGEERYRLAFELTLGWVVQHQADRNGGDWHAVVDERGAVSGDKSGAWKDPYHQGRAVLECLDALGA
jgi:cellobiose epimerase